MFKFKTLLALVILSGVILAWFVIGDSQRLRDEGNLQGSSTDNLRIQLSVPQKLSSLTVPKTITGRGVDGAALSSKTAENNAMAPFISLKAGLLSVTLEDQPLRWALDEISRQSGMIIESGPEISEERITDAFQGIPIEQGLRRLLGPWDLFFFYGGDEIGPQYVWVYPKGKGAGLRPIPPEMWASTQELEVAFNDTDPQARARALQALVERKGKLALDQLMLGLNDPDDQVRSAALNAAAHSNLEIPPGAIKKLVQNDPSPNVRFLALAALSNYVEAPSADLDLRQIANYASSDTDPEIRSLAENLIDRLETKAPVPASTH